MRLRKALGPIKAGRWIHVRCWFRKLKPPSKLGHPKFQRQSTETHPKPNHNRGRRFASAHPKTHVFFVVVASTQHHYHYHYIYVNPTLLSFHLFTFFQPLKSNLPLFLLPPTSPSSSSIMSHFKGKYHGNSLPPSLSHALIYLVVIVSCLSGSQCFFFYLLFRLSLLCLFESIWIWICLWWFRSERFRSGFLWKTLWKKN